MALEQTWRWFGPHDPVTLREIRQTGATGIVTALHGIPRGEVWPVDEILRRKALIEAEGLTWSVAESIPVHEDIKKRSGRYQHCIDTYKQSIRNLGSCRIDTVCFNFMPVLDWQRTNLEVVCRDGSIATEFRADVIAAFDIFILKRKNAGGDYTESRFRRAKDIVEVLTEEQKDNLIQTVLLGFPGSGEAYTLAGLRSALEEYEHIGEDDLRENLYSFLGEIIPVAQESGVLMALHPDDPPWRSLGLPRIVGNTQDIENILQAVDSPSNGITLCTGSLGAGAQNDLAEMAERFAHRVNFIHLRNVRRNSNGDFVETDHLDGDVDMYGVMKALILEQQRRVRAGRTDTRMPLRPDHGHLMIPDRQKKGIYPGYSLFGRMRGLAELRGLEMGIRQSLGV